MDQREYTTVAAALADVPDPRQKRGVRHPWGVVLVLIGAAMLAGQQHGRAIGQWVREHTPALREALAPARAELPSAATLRRALVAVDVGVLEARLAQVTDGQAGAGSLCGQALDGKQLRGAGAHGRPVHLLAVARHQDGRVLAQTEVGRKTNEIGAAPALVAGLDLSDTVTTVDALLAQRSLARQIRAQGGHYLMVIKENQPETYAAIAELFATAPWLPHERATEYATTTTVSRGHGRHETRVLEASTSLNAWLRWPDVAQVLRRHTRRVQLTTGQVETQTSYGVTSLRPAEVTVQQLEGFWRGHWTIENRLHYVRDVTMGEDAGQAHTGSLPQAMAALRNALLLRLRQAGWTRMADALRHYHAHPTHALTLLGVPSA